MSQAHKRPGSHRRQPGLNPGYRVINRLVARVNREKGDRNLPANIFVHLKKQES